jgi:predicted Rossmann fold nucleotide-binding protein DprA/Smf involved in DNA uptake
VDELAESIGLDAGQTLATLTSLEIRGLALHAPGKLFLAIPTLSSMSP